MAKVKLTAELITVSLIVLSTFIFIMYDMTTSISRAKQIPRDIIHNRQQLTSNNVPDEDFYLATSNAVPSYDHFVIKNVIDSVKCFDSSYHSDLLTEIQQHHVIHENLVSFFPNLKIVSGDPQFFQLCLSKHKHQHVVELNITAEDSSSDCDFYISASNLVPNRMSWDWKSNNNGDDKLTLTTYSVEYVKAEMGGFFIGIYGKSPNNLCTLGVKVFKIPNKNLLHKLSLRGGQVILPRDLDSIIGNHDDGEKSYVLP